MNKKAYMKTIEAVIAIVILFIFITTVIPKSKESEAKSPEDINLMQETILNTIKENNNYRTCILENNEICIRNYVNGIILNKFDYNITICSVPCTANIANLPEKSVYVESLIISSNITNYNTKLFTLYLWRKV